MVIHYIDGLVEDGGNSSALLIGLKENACVSCDVESLYLLWAFICAVLVINCNVLRLV